MAPGPNGWRMRSPLIDLDQRRLEPRHDVRALVAVTLSAVAAVAIALGAAVWASAIVIGGLQ